VSESVLASVPAGIRNTRRRDRDQTALRTIRIAQAIRIIGIHPSICDAVELGQQVCINNS